MLELPIQVSFAIFISVLIFLFISLSSLAPSSSTLFFFRSRFLVTKIKDLRGKPRVPLPTLFAKTFSCCASYRFVEVSGHGVQISISIYQRGKGCKSITYRCLESTRHRGIIQLHKVKPDSWLGWFPYKTLAIGISVKTW